MCCCLINLQLLALFIKRYEIVLRVRNCSHIEIRIAREISFIMFSIYYMI